MCARVAARHLWYAAVGGSDDDCGRHRAGDPAGRPKHTRCAGSGTTQSSAAPCVLRGERKLKQSHIGAVVTTVGCAGRATRQGDRSTLDVLGVRQTANHRACSTVCDRAPTMSDRRLPSDRRQKNHLKFFFQNFSKSGPVRSGSVGAPQWVDLGTVSRASSRTSVRSQAKKNHLFKKIFQNFSKSGPVLWAPLGISRAPIRASVRSEKKTASCPRATDAWRCGPVGQSTPRREQAG